MDEERRKKLDDYLRHIDVYLARALSTKKAYRSEDAAVIRAQVLAVLRAFPSLGLTVEVPEGVRKWAPLELEGQSELMGISGTIPLVFRGARYQIPVALVLPPLFPHVAPLCWVLAEKGMGIEQRHSTVDLRGQCHLVGLTWADGMHTLTDAAREMQRVFSTEPPLFSSQVASQAPASPPVALPPARQQLRPPETTSPRSVALEGHRSLDGATGRGLQGSSTTVDVRGTVSQGAAYQAAVAPPYMLALEPGDRLLSMDFAEIKHLYLRHKQADEATEASMGMRMKDLEGDRLSAAEFLRETRKLAREQFFQRAAVCQLGAAIKLVALRGPSQGPGSFRKFGGHCTRQATAEAATIRPSHVLEKNASLPDAMSAHLEPWMRPEQPPVAAHKCCSSHSEGYDNGLQGEAHLKDVLGKTCDRPSQTERRHDAYAPGGSLPAAPPLGRLTGCQSSKRQQLHATEDGEVEAELHARMREDAERLAEEVRRAEAAWDRRKAERLEQARRKAEQREQKRSREIQQMVQEGRHRAEEERRQLELRLAATAAAHAREESHEQSKVHCREQKLGMQTELRLVEEQLHQRAREEPVHAKEQAQGDWAGLKMGPSLAEHGQGEEGQRLEDLEMEKLRQDMQWTEDPTHGLGTHTSDGTSWGLRNHPAGKLRSWREGSPWQDQEGVAAWVAVKTVHQGCTAGSVSTRVREYETDERLAARLQAMELNQARSMYEVPHGFLTSNGVSGRTADVLNKTPSPPLSKQRSFLFSHVNTRDGLKVSPMESDATPHGIEGNSMPFFYPAS